MKSSPNNKQRLFCTALPMAIGFVIFGWGGRAQAAEATANTASVSSGDQIEEVIVTARRRKESIQDTPIAITAVSTSQMESVASVRVADIQGAVPNLIITQQATGASAANISLRGLSFADVEKSFDPSVAVVVDGAFIGTSTGQLLDFFDIASIEVLRGPQGTLFGRNTIGGVINIRRSRPTDEVSGKFELEYSTFATSTGRGVFNLPLIKGLLDAKFFLFHTTTDGFYKNYQTGANAGGGDNTNFGSALLFTPSDTFNALLTVEKQTSTVDNVVSQISRTGELFCGFLTPAQAAVQCNRNTTTDLYTTFTPPNSDKYSSPAVTLEMNWDPGFTHVVSISNYRSVRSSSNEDVSGFSIPFYVIDREEKYHQLSQEIRASNNITKNLDYVAGAYFFTSNYTLTQYTGRPKVLTQLTTGKSTSIAEFADFNWEFIDKWRLNFGGRFTHDEKALETSTPVGPTPATAVFTDFGNHESSFNKFTPKVSVDYRPTQDYMFYGSWSQGYRSGGYNGRGLTQVSAVTPYNPETVNSYELGAKTSWFERRLFVDVAAFYTNYKDIQETITEGGGVNGNITIVKNAASAKVKGVELDFTAKPVENVTIRGSLGYLNSHFSNFHNAEAWSATGADPNTCATATPPQCGLHDYDYSDVNLIYAPKLTGSLNFEYSIVAPYGRYKSTIGYRYIAPYDQQIARDAAVPVPQNDGTTVVGSSDSRVRTNVQNLIDASLSLSVPGEHGDTEFTVFARNLADNRGAATAFTVAGLWSFATAREPRVYGVRVGYKF